VSDAIGAILRKYLSAGYYLVRQGIVSVLSGGRFADFKIKPVYA